MRYKTQRISYLTESQRMIGNAWNLFIGEVNTVMAHVPSEINKKNGNVLLLKIRTIVDFKILNLNTEN